MKHKQVKEYVNLKMIKEMPIKSNGFTEAVSE